MVNILFFLLGSTSFAKEHYHFSNIHSYPKMNENTGWSSLPSIIICNNSPYKKETVQKAVNEWKRQGVNVGNVYKESEINVSCKYRVATHGFIAIKSYDGTFDKKSSYAYSSLTLYSSNNKIVGSECVFAPDIKNSDYTILLHELGHGLGFDHYNKKNDIMHE